MSASTIIVAIITLAAIWRWWRFLITMAVIYFLYEYTELPKMIGSLL